MERKKVASNNNRTNQGLVKNVFIIQKIKKFIEIQVGSKVMHAFCCISETIVQTNLLIPIYPYKMVNRLYPQ